MENQQPLDADIAKLLRENVEAAHFLADLAAGSQLADAVNAHFGNLLVINQEPSPEQQPQTPEPTPEPAPSEASDTPAMYQPLSHQQTETADDETSDFLASPSRSFWPQAQF